MRTAVLTYSGVMTIILLVAIISVITIKSSYSELIAQSLDDSIEYSVKSLQNDRDGIIDYASPSNAIASPSDAIGMNKRDIEWNDWTIESNPKNKKDVDEKFKQDFVRYLTSKIDSRINDLEINIYGADAEYGVMSVEITAYFDYPFGKTGKTDKVVSKKTIILNRELKNK